MTRPKALEVKIAAIPATLRAERRWLLWRYTWDGQRWGKVPFQPTGWPAKVNDSTTWSDFDTALKSLERFDGIGFVLGDGWSGIDLDNCVDGPIADQLRGTGVYVETSPSGTGLKAIGRGTRIGGELHLAKGTSTPWTSARYFAITGHGSGDAMVDLIALLDLWFSERGAPAASPLPHYIQRGDTRGTENIETRTDEDVLLAAATAANKLKFLRLFRGDTSDYGDDHSKADQALVNILYYWCQGDVDQVDRLFRLSGLMREKWNVRSYRTATLLKAGAYGAA